MESLRLSSHIDEVTVFERGALVTRVATLEATDDRYPTRVELSDLPLTLQDGSVTVAVKSDDDGTAPVATAVTLGAARAQPSDAHRSESSSARAEVVRLRLDLEQQRRERAQLDLLEPLDIEADPDPSAQLTLARFRAEQVRAALTRILELETNLEAAEGRLRQLESASADRAIVKRAFIALDATHATAKRVRIYLSYRVSGCRWAPTYRLHLSRSLLDARLSIGALVRQQTGEDWADVSLSLTTADSCPSVDALSPPSGDDGWRTPPTGADALYADYEAALDGDAPPPSEEPIVNAASPDDDPGYACAIQIDDGSGAIEVLDFDQPMINIGRGRHNHIKLADPSVSKEHARIIVKGDKMVLVDLNSLKGTTINGARIATPQVIVPGDRIGVTPLFTLSVLDVSRAAPHVAPRWSPLAPTTDGFEALGAEYAIVDDDVEVDTPPTITVTYADESGEEPRRRHFHTWELSIGRARDNDIVLARPDVSKRHARIYVHDNRCVIEDLGSSGGTLVNEQHIEGPVVVGAHDDVFISRFALLIEEPVFGDQVAFDEETVLPDDDEDDDDAILEDPGEAKKIVQPDRRYLDYRRLRMGQPGDARRGRLSLTDRETRYREGFDEAPDDVLDQIDRAAERARSVEDELAPARHRFVTSASRYDYTYRASNTVEIPSDGHPTTVAIKECAAISRSHFIAVPQHTQDVFRAIELDNPLDVPLFEGPIDIYVGGDHLLSALMKTKMADGVLQLHLGVERKIRATRTVEETRTDGDADNETPTKIERRVVIELTSELAQGAPVQILEALPIARADARVDIELVATEPQWVVDAAVPGLHRWSVVLSPTAPTTLSAHYRVQIPAGHDLIERR